MLLVFHRDGPYGAETEASALRPENEVFFSWSSEYRKWHDLRRDIQQLPSISVSSVHSLMALLSSPGRWAVAPASVIRGMKRYAPLESRPLSDPPPEMVYYILKNRYSSLSRQRITDTFRSELDRYISGDPDMCPPGRLR